MLCGLFRLTWLEIKIFLREPLGAIGTIVMPVAVFLIVGRAMGRGTGTAPTVRAASSSGCARLRCDRRRFSRRTCW